MLAWAEFIVSLLKGDSFLIIFIMFLIGLVGFFWWERQTLQNATNEKIERDRASLLAIIDKYNAGQLSVVDALNEIRIVLARIEGRIL